MREAGVLTGPATSAPGPPPIVDLPYGLLHLAAGTPNAPDQRRREAPAAAFGCSTGGSKSRPPIAWPTPTMRHGDDFHSVPAQSVNQAEGKSWEDVPSGTASMTGPSKRIVGNSVDRVPELFAEAVRRRRVSRGVPVICRFRLLRCGRVEPDGGRRPSAPVQPRSKLFPGNCLDRARVQLRHSALDLDPPPVFDTFFGLGVRGVDHEPHQRRALLRIEPHRLFKELSRRPCHVPILPFRRASRCPSNY